MPAPLRILLVEDSADDAELMLLELRRAGYDPTFERVETAAGLRAALAARPWDVILSDNALPGLNARRSLELLAESPQDVPLVVVSGTIGEECAVELMRAGAADFVMKGSLGRLAAAVKREVRQAVERRERRRAEAEARDLAAIVASSDDAILGKTLDRTITSWNAGAERLFGYAAAEVVGKNASLLVPSDCRDETSGLMGRVGRGERVEHHETVRVRKDGTRVHISVSLSPVRDEAGRVVGASAIAHDISGRVRAEAALRASEARYRRLFEAGLDGILIVDPASRRVVDANPFMTKLLGYSLDELVGKELWEVGLFRDIESNAAAFRLLQEQGYNRYDDLPLATKDGRQVEVEFVSNVYDEGDTRVIQCNIRDISERRRAEARLNLFRALIDRTTDAIEVIDPDTGRFLDVNEAACAAHGYTREEYLSLSVVDVDALAGPVPWTDLAEQRQLTGSRMIESRHRRKDGSTFPVEVSVNAINLDRGYLVAVVRDITARRQAEEALRTSETRYRTLIAATTAIVWTSPPSGAFDTDQPGWTAFTGQTVEQHRAWGWLDAIHPDDRAKSARAWAAAVAEQTAYQIEHRVRRADGEYRHMAVRAVPILDADGAIREWVGVHTDVTELKRAEEALQEREQLLQTIIANVPCGLFWKDHNSVFLGCNNQFAEDFGATHPRELVGKTDDMRAAPADAAAFVARDRQVISSGIPLLNVEETHARPDGHAVTLLTSKVPLTGPDGAVVGVLGVYLDITDRKRVEAERAELLTRLTLQIDRMPLAYLLSGPDFRYTGWNPAAERLFGFSPSEVLGRHPNEVIVPPQSRAAVADVFARLAAGAMDAHGTCENVTKDGRTVTCEWHNTPLFGPDGHFLGALSLAQDVTARIQAEEDLRLRDRAIQEATQGLVITDPSRPDNPIIYVNRGFERMTGYTSAEALGRNCRFLRGKDTDPATNDRMRAAILAGEPFAAELLNYRKDGTPFWNELSISPIRDADGRLTHFVGVQADVTARRRLEEQFRQAQRMEAFGQLAGGVAHDFNNLLTIINGYSDMVLGGLAADDPHRDMVAEVLSAGERSAGLTRQLLAFSRQQVLAPQVLDLNAVVDDTDKMLRRLIGEDVRLATVLDPQLWAVRADPGQVEQVIMNLCVNARDAMPKGGALTIETSNVVLDEVYAGTRPDAHAGPHVLLSVSDTGTGMPREVAARVFEPFFTTKGTGRGTGLGLATVHGIVQQSGGHVAVYSEVGVGTTFKVYLPRADQATVGSKSRLVARTAPRGTETVLVAEDESAVRELSRRVLSGCGYTVLEAADGDDAVRVAAGHAGRIDVLVTDVVMPGAGGRVVAERVAEWHPGVRVLYVSGYTDDAIIRHGVLREGVHFLQKPFVPVALAIKVREVLDEPTTATGGDR